MRFVVGHLVMACGLFTASSWALAAGAIESKTVHYAKGASSTTLKGSLEGDKIIDYRLRAKAGQTMRITLKSSNLSNYFNVLPPGSNDVAMFVGSSGGNEWTGLLAADGDYTIRVYLMRNAARRNETAKYTLIVSIIGNAEAMQALGPALATDAKVKGTLYHATGQVPCSMGSEPQSSVQCDFGVIRGKPGTAEIHLTPPGGFRRVLMFAAGKVTSDGDATVKAGKSGAAWLVDVNDYEHYRIPEAVISGG